MKPLEEALSRFADDFALENETARFKHDLEVLFWLHEMHLRAESAPDYVPAGSGDAAHGDTAGDEPSGSGSTSSPQPAGAPSPIARAKRLDAWADRQPDPHPDDSWAEIASAAKAAMFARAAIRHVLRKRPYMQPEAACVEVPWDGAGGQYRVWLDPAPHVDARDEYYLGKEYALALERFVESVLGVE